MNNHKATPEQWKADKYDWSKADTEAMDNDSAFRCILELRARVEALEAQAGSQEVAEPAPVAGEAEELVAELRAMATDAAAACQFCLGETLTRAANMIQRQSEQEAGR
jgi:hypothetical protein